MEDSDNKKVQHRNVSRQDDQFALPVPPQRVKNTGEDHLNIGSVRRLGVSPQDDKFALPGPPRCIEAIDQSMKHIDLDRRLEVSRFSKTAQNSCLHNRKVSQLDGDFVLREPPQSIKNACKIRQDNTTLQELEISDSSKSENAVPPESISTSEDNTKFMNDKYTLNLDYEPPRWSDVPDVKLKFEIIKEGCVIETITEINKPYLIIGRYPSNDWILEHESISRLHAILQFERDGSAYLYDLGSTHGSFINKKRVIPRVHNAVHEGDNPHTPTKQDNRGVSNVKQDPRKINLENQCNQKTIDTMLAEIKALCVAIEENLDLSVFQVYNDSNTSLYASRVELNLENISSGAGIVEINVTGYSKKEAKKNVIMQLYTELLNRGIFDIYRKKLDMQALKAYHEESQDDEYYTKDFFKKKRIAAYSSNDPVTINRLLSDRDKINKLIDGELNKIDVVRNLINNINAREQDEIEVVINSEKEKEAHKLISECMKEMSILNSELDEVNKLIKLASPSVLHQQENPTKRKSATDSLKVYPAKHSKDVIEPRNDIKPNYVIKPNYATKSNDVIKLECETHIPPKSTKQYENSPTLSESHSNDIEEKEPAEIKPKLKFGLHIPESRSKGQKRSETEQHGNERSKKIRNVVILPVKPSAEILEELNQKEQRHINVLEMEDSINCIDPQTGTNISENDIKEMNAKYGY